MASLPAQVCLLIVTIAVGAAPKNRCVWVSNAGGCARYMCKEKRYPGLGSRQGARPRAPSRVRLRCSFALIPLWNRLAAKRCDFPRDSDSFISDLRKLESLAYHIMRPPEPHPTRVCRGVILSGRRVALGARNCLFVCPRAGGLLQIRDRAGGDWNSERNLTTHFVFSAR